jgi:hypothetical protein
VTLAGCSSGSGAAAPRLDHGGAFTLTGYVDSTPEAAGTKTSVRITSAELARFRGAIDRLAQKGAPTCMENEDLFSITVTRPGSPNPVYEARSVLCPAPGVVVVSGTHTASRSYGLSCALLKLVASYLPLGKAAPCRYFSS